MILKFGKFKGQDFYATPQWYQEWLLNQNWFKLTPKVEIPLHQQLNGWNGHSRRGQAIYDAMFEQEKSQGEHYDRLFNLDSSDPDSPCYGL